ncbi:hypothetical protein Micbo1qcDRAFT_166654 [Microdochium bolleyi]|uniref:Uncharacterized protein n=1 Tax=Microdochium bolleyi TaxID=196109 RepID=A0A136IUL2_9PEZI|nr:hypothetical protein Micbo1qcDRAFT_166654 [Microdochium bolleyi]
MRFCWCRWPRYRVLSVFYQSVHMSVASNPGHVPEFQPVLGYVSPYDGEGDSAQKVEQSRLIPKGKRMRDRLRYCW